VAFSPVLAAFLALNNTIFSVNDPASPLVKFSSLGSTLESSFNDWYFFMKIDFWM
jgi:hypothetical protein